jgi:hypothetical protein
LYIIISEITPGHVLIVPNVVSVSHPTFIKEAIAPGEAGIAEAVVDPAFNRATIAVSPL